VVDLGVQSHLLVGRIIKFDQLVNLVERACHSLLTDHLGDDCLRLVRANPQEVAEFFERDVQVDFRKHTNVMFDQSFVQRSVAVLESDLLMDLQLSFKLFGLCWFNHTTSCKLLYQVIMLGQLNSFIF
jgi:hypothetical protein